MENSEGAGVFYTGKHVFVVVDANTRSKHFEQLIIALQRAGATVSLVSLQGRGPIHHWIQQSDIQGVTALTLREPRMLHVQLVNTRARAQLFATGHKPAIFAWLIRKLYRIPYAMSYSHQPNFFRLMKRSPSAQVRARGLAHGFLENQYLRDAVWIHSSSKEADDRLASLDISHSRIKGFPFGIDLDGHSARHQESWSIDTGAEPWINGKFILSIGRLAPEKNHLLTIRAFSYFQEQLPHIALVILGEGPDRLRLAQEIRERNLTDKVYLPGFVSYTAQALNKALLFTHASLTESYGAVLVEARVHEVPIVASPTGIALDMAASGDPLVSIVDSSDPRVWAKTWGKMLAQDQASRETDHKWDVGAHSTDSVVAELSRLLMDPMLTD